MKSWADAEQGEEDLSPIWRPYGMMNRDTARNVDDWHTAFEMLVFELHRANVDFTSKIDCLVRDMRKGVLPGDYPRAKAAFSKLKVYYDDLLMQVLMSLRGSALLLKTMDLLRLDVNSIAKSVNCEDRTKTLANLDSVCRNKKRSKMGKIYRNAATHIENEHMRRVITFLHGAKPELDHEHDMWKVRAGTPVLHVITRCHVTLFRHKKTIDWEYDSAVSIS